MFLLLFSWDYWIFSDTVIMGGGRLFGMFAFTISIETPLLEEIRRKENSG